MSTAVKPAEFVAEDEQVQLDFHEQDAIVVGKATKRARVKGTWHMVYGEWVYDFVDAQFYELPFELFMYLKQRGCIYDTMI